MKKSEAKKFYTFVAVSAMVIAVVVGVLVYNLKSQPGLFFQQENQMELNNNSSQESPVEFQGRTLVANPAFPIGVIDGIVDNDPDIAGQTIVLRADVLKIYPEAPFDSKLITISVENAEVFFMNNGRNLAPDDIRNIKAGTAISVGLAEGETNRDILFKDEFEAIKITFFDK